MKNKDIPEGGSKCVVLVDVCGIKAKADKDLVLRKSVKVQPSWPTITSITS
jgi:NAD-specific glutamate dehydrogenase